MRNIGPTYWTCSRPRLLPSIDTIHTKLMSASIGFQTPSVAIKGFKAYWTVGVRRRNFGCVAVRYESNRSVVAEFAVLVNHTMCEFGAGIRAFLQTSYLIQYLSSTNRPCSQTQVVHRLLISCPISS
jgi:hypothetical protein